MIEILSKLQEEKIKNINMINFIENYSIDKIEVEGESILVKGKSDENWIYISSSSEDELEFLLDKSKEDEFFAVVEDWMIPYLAGDRKIDWKLSCMKLFFPEEKELPESKYQVSKLSIDDAQHIYDNSKYKDYTSVSYIKERIIKGIGLGIYEDEELVAWIMTHDDGAIGFLNVLEGYRNRGYGYSLTASITEKLRNINKIPFVHIEEDNIPSMELARKLGFVVDRRVHWIKVSHGDGPIDS